MASINSNSSLDQRTPLSPPQELNVTSSSSPLAAEEASSSWQTLRMIGRQHYQNGQYDAAYYAFQNAYIKMKQQQQQSSTSIPPEELQYVLSNIIACRLQIGGVIHLENAIKESKECIAMNPTWSKAYIRLASSYMALRTYYSHRGSSSQRSENHNYSNDICNALQTAIRYDPNNATTAKQMLLQELRLRNQTPNSHNSNNSSASASTNPPPIHPNYIPPSTPFHNSTETNDTSTSNPPPIPLEGFDENDNSTATARGHHHPGSNGTNLQPQWMDWNEYGNRMLQSSLHNINVGIQQVQVRYHSLPSNHRKALTFVFILVLLLVMYSSHNNQRYNHGRQRKMKGNYGSDNIYEQIRREKLQRQQQQQQQQRQYYNNDPYHPDQRPYQRYDDHPPRNMYDPNIASPYSRSSRSSSFEVNGMIYMVIIAVAVYVGHTYFGINPWQMILLLRMVQNGGGGGGGGGFMWYNGGYGRGRQPYRRRGYW